MLLSLPISCASLFPFMVYIYIYIYIYEINSSYIFFKPLDLSRSNGQKKTHVNANILIDLIYYPIFNTFLYLSLNQKKKSTFLSLSLLQMAYHTCLFCKLCQMSVHPQSIDKPFLIMHPPKKKINHMANIITLNCIKEIGVLSLLFFGNN